MPSPASIPTDLPTGYYIPRHSQLDLWASKRRACPHLAADAAMAAARWQEMQTTVTDDQVSKSRRGRPPVTLENPASPFVPLLHWERPSWFDDIVRGSIASSVGARKGQLNVRVSDVCAALHLKVISVAAIKRPDMPDRSAQSIAQAARHAARGIFHYIFQHPQAQARLIEEYELECALAYR